MGNDQNGGVPENGGDPPPGKPPKMALRGPLGVKRKFVEKMRV